jgi:adenylate kinase
VKYVVLLGPPGAGKGTQAPALAEELGGTHLSTGDLLRDAARSGSDLGRRADEFMRAGQLVPDEIVLGMVLERMHAPDSGAAVILDGFPRNLVQAEALDQALAARGESVCKALVIEVPKATLVARLGGRLVCPNCRAVYHESSRPPRVEGICDRCGSALKQRSDDRPEAVEERLRVYESETAPVLEHYRSLGRLLTVDGSQVPTQVTEDLLMALRG